MGGNINTKEFMELVQKIFFEKLEKKNGWGKNEVKQLHKDSVSEALMSLWK